MIGAIIGDLAGSVYEFEQTKNVKPIKMNKIIEENSFFSDDTILTIAVADAVLNNLDYGKTLKKYALEYSNKLPNEKPYFKTMFSPNFTSWANGNVQGFSLGNGAMMRISPIGFLFNTEADVIKNVRKATIPSHNSEEAIMCSTIVALIIFYAGQGYTKKQIMAELNITLKKPTIKKFNTTCKETIDVCLYSVFKAKSFEDSIKIALSFGGDTDTNACIVGGMAEAIYGIDENLKQQALKKLPKKFVEVLEKCYYKVDELKRQTKEKRNV